MTGTGTADSPESWLLKGLGTLVAIEAGGKKHRERKKYHRQLSRPALCGSVEELRR